MILNKKKLINIIILFILLIYSLKIIYLLTNTEEEFYRIGTFLRLDSIAFGMVTRIYFNKIKSNLFNILLTILILFSMNYFYVKIPNLNSLDLFLFILLIQIFSINIIIFFINLNELIKNKILINFFSLLSKQTYSIYLFQ